MFFLCQPPLFPRYAIFNKPTKIGKKIGYFPLLNKRKKRKRTRDRPIQTEADRQSEVETETDKSGDTYTIIDGLS